MNRCIIYNKIQIIMKNNNLTKAKTAKNDEFYTQMIDIENELQHYTKHFKGKVVYCNCDDPKQSNFVKYFYENFETLGLKKLISSCYVDNSIDLFNQNPTNKATYFEYSGIDNIELKPKFENIEVKPLKGNGDFRSYECIEFLKKSDMVVTNPPFSLFRDFVTLLVKHNKKFLVIGNQLAIKYHSIFPLIKNEELRLGITYPKKFRIPNYYTKWSEIDSNGNKYNKVSSIWFTNIEHDVKNEKLTLTKTYYGNESNYPKFDNYDAINVDKTKDIPKDYEGLMGVPISFLTKYNSDQFTIIDGFCRYSWLTGSTKDTIGKFMSNVNNEPKFARIIIKHKQYEK